MEVEMDQTAEEIKRLQGCINDLISDLALPALWSGYETSQIVSTLLDVLLGMLRLDFAYARLSAGIDDSPIEVVRVAQRRHLAGQPQEAGRALSPWLTGDPPATPFVVPNPVGEGEVTIAPFRLGLQEEVGVVVAGSQRADFPTVIERLLLRVAANQAAMGLQEARRLSEQRRSAEELERRVGERTRQLTAANEELRKEIIERKQAEEALRRSETYLAEAQRLTHTGSFALNVATREYVYWSQEHSRLFGFDPEGGLPSFEAVLQRTHPEDRARCLETIERATRERTDCEVDYRTVLPDGTMKYLHSVAHSVFN